jgi:thiol-disulfide isomerase/thioredoxin
MIKKLLTVVFILAIIGALIYIFTGNEKIKTSYTPQQNLNAPIEIPAEGIIALDEANSLDRPQVIMFYVDWCGYCRRFMPKFGDYAKKYSDKYSFVVVNADKPENKEFVGKYHIVGFPSLFIVDNEINHKFSMHPAVTVDENIFIEELDSYLAVRDKIKK